MRVLVFSYAFFFAFSVKAQQPVKESFLWSIRAGASTSGITGDGYRGFHKYNAVGGVALQMKLAKRFTGTMEALFLQKGSKHKGDALLNFSNLTW